MDTPEGPPLDPSKLIILIMFDPFWICEALGDTLTSIAKTITLGNALLGVFYWDPFLVLLVPE